MTAFRNELTAADDAQRMLLWCILHDALEGQYTAEEDCSACQTGGRAACLSHWDAHEASANGYRELQMRVERYTGRASGFPLDAQAQRVILAALEGAIAFRSTGQAKEDLALMTAYQLLRRDLMPASADCDAVMGITARAPIRPTPTASA